MLYLRYLRSRLDFLGMVGFFGVGIRLVRVGGRLGRRVLVVLRSEVSLSWVDYSSVFLEF